VAKAVSEATGRQQLTTAGVALGTPAYMAPEQAVADPHVDHRADIYAVGAMGYEVLTGRPPFTGSTPQEVLAAHVTTAPEPITRRRETVPPALAEALMRCLAKKPADRWQSAGELLHHLESLATPSGGTMPTLAPAPTFRRRAWRPGVAMAGGVGVGAVVLAGVLWLSRDTRSAPLFGRSIQVTAEPGLEIHPAISRDGRLVAYASGTASRMRIFIRPVGGGRTIPLSDDSTAVESQPRWSPDGEQLLFLTRGGVSVASALGGIGRPVVAPAAGVGVLSADWSPTGQEIVFVQRDSVYVVGAQDSAPRLIATGPAVHSCRWSRDGRWIACVQGNWQYLTPGRTFGNLAPSGIVLYPAAGGSAIPITGTDVLHQSPEWSPEGRRLFFVSNRDGPRDVYAQDIASGGRPRGVPVRITTGLNAQSLSVSADGRRIAYTVYTARANIWSLPIPTGGPVTPDAATPLTLGNQVIEAMRVSRDGRWLVFDSDLRGNADIYRIPASGGQVEQLTNEPFDEFAPDLSPDGSEVAYHSFRTGTRDIEVKRLDGAPAQRVTDTPRQESYPVWAPNGRAIAFLDQPRAPTTAMLVRRAEDGTWSMPDTIGIGGRPVWSPDGRQIAYPGVHASTGLDLRDLVVYSIESRTRRVVYRPTDQEPTVGLAEWGPDGRTFYFKSHDAEGRASIWSVVEGQRPRLLVRFPNPDRPSNRIDFATDGKRLYFTLEDRESDVFVVEVV
jgi:Tol biopolymer transport system component